MLISLYLMRGTGCKSEGDVVPPPHTHLPVTPPMQLGTFQLISRRRWDDCGISQDCSRSQCWG